MDDRDKNQLSGSTSPQKKSSGVAKPTTTVFWIAELKNLKSRSEAGKLRNDICLKLETENYLKLKCGKFGDHTSNHCWYRDTFSNFSLIWNLLTSYSFLYFSFTIMTKKFKSRYRVNGLNARKSFLFKVFVLIISNCATFQKMNQVYTSF